MVLFNNELLDKVNGSKFDFNNIALSTRVKRSIIAAYLFILKN